MSYLSGHIAADLFLFTQLDRIEKKETKLELHFYSFVPQHINKHTAREERNSSRFNIKNSCSCCSFVETRAGRNISKVDHLFLLLGVTE